MLRSGKEKSKSKNNQLDLFAENTPDTPDVPKFSNFESIKTVEHEYKLIDNEEEASKLCDFLLTSKVLSLDTETTSTDTMQAELVGLSFAIEEKKAFYVAIPSDRREAENS